jgi:hypothetical protein
MSQRRSAVSIFTKTLGRAQPDDSDRTPMNYNTLFGFGPTAERIDPHTHVQRDAAVPDLSRVVEMVRQQPLSPEKLSGETQTDEHCRPE